MSYNYNQYSPYYQQTSGQDGRAQYPDQSRSNQSYQSSSYSYQPLTAYQSELQRHQASASQPASNPTNSYASHGYGSANSAGDSHGQSTGETYTNGRTPVDTTALGNLAYISSLGRDNSSYPQIMDYNRPQNPSRPGSSTPYGINAANPIQYRTGHERTDSSGSSSRGNANTRVQQATQSTPFGQQGDSRHTGHQGQAVDPSNSSGGYTQSEQAQASRPPSEQYRPSQYPAQPSRPASGQAVQHPRSSLGSQVMQSPTTSITQTTPHQSNIQGRRESSGARAPEQARTQTPQQTARQPHPSGASNSLRDGGSTSKPQNQQSPRNQASHKPSEINSNQSVTHASTKEARPPVVDTAVNEQTSQTLPAAGDPYPATVDPSQVFNQIEYQRRQAAAAAEAEAAKKAAQAAASAPIPSLPAPSNSKMSEPDNQNAASSSSSVVNSVNTDPEAAKKDQMELEMKQMIEKMRDYKAKNPSLFSQIWEQVKKGQPPQRASSQPGTQCSSESPIVINGQLPSPSPTHNQFPQESELSLDQPFPPGLDRGRFPAQRRRRGGAKGTLSRKSDTPKGQMDSAPPSQLRWEADTGSPAVGTPTPPVAQMTADPDPESQRLRKAMEDFHQNSHSPMPAQPSNGGDTAPPAPTTASAVSVNTQLQPRPPPPETGKTYWPEHKKRALADAARIALTSTHPNANKTIKTEEIHELLDQNPSYTQMCEILEYRGFVIDRGQFARLLLAAVPDMNSAPSPNTQGRPSQPPSKVQGTAPETSPATVSASAPASRSPKRGRGRPPKGTGEATIGPTKHNAQSTAPATIPKPLPFAHPSSSTPDSYITPYRPIPPGPQTQNQSNSQQDETNQSSGPAQGYRSVNSPQWQGAVSSATHSNVQHQPNLWPNAHAAVPPPFGALAPSGQGPSDSTTQVPGAVQPPNGVTWVTKKYQKPPSSKQEMARKRTFGEIVDLTQALSDDENELRHQRPRLEPRPEPRPDNRHLPPPSVIDPANQPLMRPNAHPLDKATAKLASKHYTPEQSKSAAPVAKMWADPAAKAIMDQYRYKPSGREHLWVSDDVVRPMNKRRDALRRSTYNPKTIARDFLVAVGKHPTIAPLNAHLDILRDRFHNVNHDSDLSSFKWDLVDPGGEPAPVQRVSVLPDTDMHDADDEDADTPSRQSFQRHHPRVAVVIGGDGGLTGASEAVIQAPNKDIARSSFKPSRGGHGTSGTRARPSGNESPSNPSPGNPQRRSTQGSANTPQSSSSLLNVSQYIFNDPRSLDMPDFRPTGQDSLTSGSSSTPAGRPPVSSISGSSSILRRIGRPPGAKNKSPRPDKGIPKKNKTPVPSPGGEQVAMPTRPRPVDTTPARPSGLRHALTPTDGIAVVIESRSPSMPDIVHTDDSDRPAKKEKTAAERARKMAKAASSGRHPSKPSYKVYRCLWEDCPAELHNLETLKKHVRKHRDRFGDGPFPCLWANCHDSKIPIPKDTPDDEDRERLKFKSEASWYRHMDGRHLTTIAWELGDGPSIHSSDVESSDYLSDSQGRQITPFARTSGRSDPLPLDTHPKAVPEYHNAHDNETELEKANARMESHRARKRAIGGIGIERTGPNFVTSRKRDLLAESADPEGSEMRKVDDDDSPPPPPV